MNDRRLEALRVRQDAAQLASDRPHPPHVSNGEELRYRDGDNKPTLLGSYTKGLPHDYNGVIDNADDFQQFVRGIDSGDERDFQATPLGPLNSRGEADPANPSWKSSIALRGATKVRAWESAGAGSTFDLEGPDAQSVTMPSAPVLDSPELISEMVEVYSMALLRDLPFSELKAGCSSDPKVERAIARMSQTDWVRGSQAEHELQIDDLTVAERSRLRGPFTRQTIFRGITPGDAVGPYLSQFLLIGNTGLGCAQALEEGQIAYGSIRIDQRVRNATPEKDYMTTWEAWLDVQNGADLRGVETYESHPKYRFMATPRDLATYVHYDALYEAYLNACLILLGLKMPFDPGIPFQGEDFRDRQQGFAQFGGPHILSLVTEVATRALKAVRFQKFNVHRRARPEAVGGWLSRYCNDDREGLEVIGALADGMGEGFLSEIAAHNAKQNEMFNDRVGDRNCGWLDSFLLPMAFPEGSPMHPAYGAGHGTVAGACVTILKAFFDHGALLLDPTTKKSICFEPDSLGQSLRRVEIEQPLTVEGELNKLASNIAIGRNWAGVHYFTDYIESIRLGEKIALGILEEQKLTYGENFSMTVPLFDGGTVRI
ncbi:MAG: vanadium-dependent haloperoxidase [Elainellaceae cyanobacterium]